jgi:hypothetical protein
MERAKKAGIGTFDYVNEIQGYSMYVAGFQTAYNLQTPNTCDIFASYNDEQLLTWLENYCREKPLEKFGAGVVALAKEVYPKRLQTCGQR